MVKLRPNFKTMFWTNMVCEFISVLSNVMHLTAEYKFHKNTTFVCLCKVWQGRCFYGEKSSSWIADLDNFLFFNVFMHHMRNIALNAYCVKHVNFHSNFTNNKDFFDTINSECFQGLKLHAKS